MVGQMRLVAAVSVINFVRCGRGHDPANLTPAEIELARA